jgi:uncharacterized protein YcnI
MFRVVAKAAVTVAAAGLLVGGLTSVANAHVKVSPEVAAKGATTVDLTFTMPNERDDARTTGITIELPQDAPFATVTVPDHPGWTSSVRKVPLAKPIEVDGKTITEVVNLITWTVDDPAKALKDNEREDFLLSVGPMPDADQVVFKALQTYDSGETVRWIQIPDASNNEPERPAPIIKLIGKGSGKAEAPSRDSGSLKAAFVGGGVVAVLLAGGAFAFVAFRRKA